MSQRRLQIGTAIQSAAYALILGAVLSCSDSSDPPAVEGIRFTSEPSGAVAGQTFSVVVQLVTNSGELVTSANDVVTLGVDGAGTLQGATTASAVGGVATFTGLSITRAGQNFRLTASAKGFSNTGTAFAVDAGAASAEHSLMTLGSGTPSANVPVTVSLVFKDAYDNALANKAVNLTTNLGGATFDPSSGTTDANGAFSTTFRATGAGSATISATVGGLALSFAAPITVVGASAVRFVAQPSNVVAGQTFSVSVELIDAAGARVTSATNAITLTVNNGFTLSGTTTVAAINGLAVFSGLSASVAATGYRLTATSGALSVQSNLFNVTAGTPAVSTSTMTLSTGLTVGGSSTATFTIRDSFGNAVAGANVSLTSTVAGLQFAPSSGQTNASGVFTSIISPTLAGNGTVTATVSGTPLVFSISVLASAGDYNVAGALFTQATQVADGSIPMVLGGNGAAVNVTLSSTFAGSQSMQVVLRLFNAGGTLIRSDTLQVPVPGTAQFLLPPSALVAGMRWQVVRDPKGLFADSDPATDVFPRGAPVALPMVNVPTLKVRFVPIVLTAHSNTTGNINAGNIAEYTRTLESVHPLASIQASVGAAFTTAQSFGTPPSQGGDADAFWKPILQALDVARLADPDPTTHWVGVVLPPAGFNLTLNGGIGYVPSFYGSGAGTRTSMVTSFGWAANAAFTRETVAHELGHNFGRSHAPCGGPLGPDPSFPYPAGNIGVAGHDVRGWLAGRTVTAVAQATTMGDIMSYCAPYWISDYTYRAVLNFRGTTAAGVGAASIATSARATRVLMVRGAIQDGSTITLEPTFAVDARPTRPESDGPYRMEARASDGRVLFAYNFAPSVIDHAPNAGHFAFAIPVTADVESTIASIEVRGRGGVARLSRPTVAPSPRAATLTQPQRLAGGLVSVACSDANARGILVRDAAGSLLGVASGSTTSVVATAGASLTVVCSDGVQSLRTAVIAP